jgi:hypothetical protein
MNGIVTIPLVPLRESDNDCSELFSQLLFGERVEILETHERWLFVRTLTDNYKGWVDRKMLRTLTIKEDEQIENVSKYFVQVPLLLCVKNNSHENMFLPGGSIFPDLTNGCSTICDEIYNINSSQTNIFEEVDGNKIVNLAMQYLNAPYLLGGKSVFGIDCSGLVQVVFSMVNKTLPREAFQQVESGKVIDFLYEAQAGDLAFFEDEEGKIIHVGIMLNTNQIIHSFGWVKIDFIDSQGIISTQNGEYTHNLRVLKRLI